MKFGFLLILLAGICQGTFGLGYKKYPPFKWEVFWMVYNLLCIVVSTLAAVVMKPDIFTAYASLPAANVVIPILCGVLWGMSAIGFSKGIDLIGMSLVYGLSMGISTIVGSVVPIIMDGGTLPSMMVVGLLITLVGIAIITKAGVMRENSTSSKLGLVLAMLSGLGSGAMNIGFSVASPVSETYASNAPYLAISSGQWLLVLLGGCIGGAIVCAVMMFRARSYNTLTQKGSLKRIGILFLVSLVWYAALIIYGCATNFLGENAEGIGWILFNSLALVISNAIGLKMGEWKNKQVRKWLFIGDAILVLSWIVLIAFV